MKRSLIILGCSIVASAALGFAGVSTAATVRHHFASCVPSMVSPIIGNHEFWHYQGSNYNTTQYMGLDCEVTDTDVGNVVKGDWNSVTVYVTDNNSSSDVNAMLCARAKTTNSGGCSSSVSSSGTGTDTLTLSVGTRWDSSGDFGSIRVNLPPKNTTNPSRVHGYEYSN